MILLMLTVRPSPEPHRRRQTTKAVMFTSQVSDAGQLIVRSTLGFRSTLVNRRLTRTVLIFGSDYARVKVSGLGQRWSTGQPANSGQLS
ncbi:hypothetical protein HanRHA438_Chr16g0753091 [Helianthus annuus]|nr:hypothetical protein HanRHA438_Chr16g0753091 [Helianthus annuus]